MKRSRVNDIMGAAGEMIRQYGFVLPPFANWSPQEFKANADGRSTMEAVLAKMRVTLLKLRNKEHVEAAVTQMAKLVMGRHAPDAPDQGAGPTT